ncbi:glutathione S-transferase family protein [Caulobacter sp. S45]|jgi:glutathione S-transferase|uniref:glutathione S-transferase family protein n=1 Tax=Caulobacter sp. S45 TaxID=1641861 RepID=UPI00131CB805|nr:glutathione S-transferase family protein [Caulobacter sp. S45]
MKLYSDPFAPNPRRVLWLMAEKGIDDIQVVRTETMKAEHRAPAYLAKAGLPLVPALELDDGTVISESIAICRYLESLHPEPNLFGRDPLETAVIEMWTRRAELLFATPLMLAVRNSLPALATLGPQSPERAASEGRIIETYLPLFERRLGDSPFLGADRLTMADIVAAASVGFGRLIRFEFPGDCPNLRRWWDVMRERPGAKSGR